MVGNNATVVNKEQEIARWCEEFSTLMNEVVDGTRDSAVKVAKFVAKDHPEWGTKEQVGMTIETFAEAAGGLAKALVRGITPFLIPMTQQEPAKK